MVIPNMVMKFHNFDIFVQILLTFACRVESIKLSSTNTNSKDKFRKFTCFCQSRRSRSFVVHSASGVLKLNEKYYQIGGAQTISVFDLKCPCLGIVHYFQNVSCIKTSNSSINILNIVKGKRVDIKHLITSLKSWIALFFIHAFILVLIKKDEGFTSFEIRCDWFKDISFSICNDKNTFYIIIRHMHILMKKLRKAITL